MFSKVRILSAVRVGAGKVASIRVPFTAIGSHRVSSAAMRIARPGLPVFALFACALACATRGGDPGAGSPTPTVSPDPSASPTPLGGDETTFLRILDGTLARTDGFAQIAASGGWPIQTPGGFLFARIDDGNGPWRLAGDFDGFTPETMTLESGVWWKKIAIAAPVDSKYKFVDGATQFSADGWSRRYGYDNFGEFSLVAAGPKHLERFFAITDGVVAARTLRVWVPALAATHHLYVHDGQNLFDPAAPNGGWHLQDALMAVAPHTLAVGIDNTTARFAEYTHVTDVIGGTVYGGQGDAYADFVANTVRPLIQSHFGVPAKAGTMGSSLGGLIALHIAQRHPAEFDFAASLSGTMGWGSIDPGVHNSTMIQRYAAAGHGSSALYLDSGGGDGGSPCVDSDSDLIQDDDPNASDNYCENLQLANALVGAGYTADLQYFVMPGALHNEAAWAARVSRPVQFFDSL